jgi:hypothetical protein
MPRRASFPHAAIQPATVTGAGTNYLVQTPSGVLYSVLIDEDSDISYRKSTDGGLSWSAGTSIFAGTATSLAVWYDRWSNISAGLIHCVYSESATDDTLYRTINTESSDALSTQTVIFAGASTAAGGHLSVTRAVGGNVYCKTVIDGGTEGGFYRLPNANVPSGAWDAARTVDEAIASTDQMILLPDYDAADTQDIMAIFWDASANEISRKLYDDSANTWSETSIAGSMTDESSSVTFPNFAAAMDITNTRHFVIAWNGVDGASSRLRAWSVDSGTITALTDVVSSSTDDQGLAGLSYDPVTGYLYAYYGGKTDGSETYPSALNLYCKVSTDTGTTWGPETPLTTTARRIECIYAIPLLLAPMPTPPAVLHGYMGAIYETMYLNLGLVQPRVTVQIGL